MMEDEELDFEEDVDFGNVDSLLYETTDENITQEVQKNEESNDSESFKSCEEDNNGSDAEVDNRSDRSESPQIEDTNNDSPDSQKSEQINVNDEQEVDETANEDNISEEIDFSDDSKDLERPTEPLIVNSVPQNTEKAFELLESFLLNFEEPSVEDNSGQTSRLNESPLTVESNQKNDKPIPIKTNESPLSVVLDQKKDKPIPKKTNESPLTVVLDQKKDKPIPKKTNESPLTVVLDQKNDKPIPKSTPKSTPKPTPEPIPKSTPKPTPKPTPKSTPKTTPKTLQEQKGQNKVENKTNKKSAKLSESSSDWSDDSSDEEKKDKPNKLCKQKIELDSKNDKTPKQMVVLDQNNDKPIPKKTNESPLTVVSDQKNHKPIPKKTNESQLTVVSVQKNDKPIPKKTNEPPLTVVLGQKNDKPIPNQTNDINITPNNTPLMFTSPGFGLRKTVDLDQKYYNSMRIYLTERKIIGYNEDTFREEAKRFKLKKDKLMFNGREVIETEERQRKISIEFHLNATAKTPKSRHRGVVATTRAIESKYFWGTIKFDVESVINHCRVCNPKEYDLTSYQLWKYIEIGVIEDVLIVRDLSEKSSIFNCAFVEEMSPLNLSKHLIDMFKTYGTPNAIRIVLEQQLQKQFTEKLRAHLHKGLHEFLEDVEFVSQNSTVEEPFKLPRVDLLIEYNSNKCPKSEKELQTTYTISVDEDISLIYIFSCNNWLIPDPLRNKIANDIKNFAQKFQNWKSKVSSLTLYFQINGINLKANEEEEEEENNTQESTSSTSKSKHSSTWRELARLQTDFKDFDPNKEKRKSKEQNKTNKKSAKTSDSSESDDDFSDESSVSSSKPSQTTKLKNTKQSTEKNDKSSPSMEMPFKTLLRENAKEVNSIEIIDVDDDSQQSAISQLSSVQSLSSETKTPEPPPQPIPESQSISDNNIEKSDIEKYDPFSWCQPCAVLLNTFSQQDIENAIEGNYQFSEVLTNNSNANNSEDICNSPILISSDTQDSDSESEPQPSPKIEVSPSKTKPPVKDSVIDPIKAIIDEELKKRTQKDQSMPSLDLNLSEDSSSEVETNGEKEFTSKRSTTDTKLKVTLRAKVNTPVRFEASVPPKNSRRKRNAKNSDNDSDYDIKKDESSLKKSDKKRVKFDAIPKTLGESQSNQKRRVTQISKSLVVSESDSSDSDDENLVNNTPKMAPKKPKTVSNSETKIEVFKCNFCDFSTNVRNNYIMHSGKHRGERKNPMLCPDCSKVFYNKDDLESHKKEEHPIVFQNTILYGCECKKFCSVVDIQQLDEHLKTHIEDLSFLKTSSKFRCDLCNKFSSPNMEGMTTHLTQKHRNYQCVFDCTFVASDFQTLERHSKTLHSRCDAPYECKYCDFNTTVFGVLVQHRQKTHAIEWVADLQTNKCGLCDTYFTYDDTNHIIEHLSTHSMIFDFFECKPCNKRCRSFEQFRKHCETHHAVGPADGLEGRIGNLEDLFVDLRKQLSEQNNTNKKMSANSNETQNAILGLMDEQFDVDEGVEDNNRTDLVATALSFAFEDEMDGYEPPTLSIPEPDIDEEETNEDAVAYIAEDDEGQWLPV